MDVAPSGVRQKSDFIDCQIIRDILISLYSMFEQCEQSEDDEGDPISRPLNLKVRGCNDSR